MKLVILELKDVPAESILGAPDLPTLADLVQAGWHGRVRAAASGDCPDPVAALLGAVAAAGGRVVSFAGQSAGIGMEEVLADLARGDWAAIHVVLGAPKAAGPETGGRTRLRLHDADAGLASILGAADGDAAVLVFSSGTEDASDGTAGVWVLAGTGAAGGSARDQAGLADVVRTMCEFGGVDCPQSLAGASLLHCDAPRSPAATAEEEELMRQHLQGLGYL